MPVSDETASLSVSAVRSRAYRARQKAATDEHIAALESDLASVRAKLLSLRARIASHQDLEAELVWYRTVALAALTFKDPLPEGSGTRVAVY